MSNDMDLFSVLLARGKGGGGGGTPITIDTQVLPDSTNPVQNMAIYSFVNSSVSTNTAYFKGTFYQMADLEAVADPTNNDYAFYVVVKDATLTTSQPDDWTTNWTDYFTKNASNEYIPVTGSSAPAWVADTYYKSNGDIVYDRYKYVAISDTSDPDYPGTWEFEYELNNSSFTANQWSAINSGITPGLVIKLSGMHVSDVAIGTATLTPDTNGKVTIPISSTSAAGALKASSTNGFTVDSSGNPSAANKTAAEYGSAGNGLFVGKGTLDNLLTAKNINDVSNDSWTFAVDDGNGNITAVTKTVKVGASS